MSSKVRFEGSSSPREKDKDKSKDKDSSSHKSSSKSGHSSSSSRNRSESKRDNRPEYFFADSEKRSVSNHYTILEKIAAGGFGVVKRARKKDSGEMAALKCIKKADANPRELQNEVNILRMVQGHPEIVKLLGVYESKNRVNIIMELITGGELFDRIVEIEHYTEADAANLMKQIASAVQICHTKNVVHRDLKPENLLFEDPHSNKLKLIDFGVAEVMDGDKPLRGIVGSRTYMAPEVAANLPYGKPADMYSMGIIMYILLCGFPPFDPEQGIIELEFPSPEWDDVSQTAKDLIVALLDDDPTRRPTAAQLKEHPWITGKESSRKELRSAVRSMTKFNTYRKVASAAIPSRNRRVSVFGMFGLNKERQTIQADRGGTTEESGKQLQLDMDQLHQDFKKVAAASLAYAMRQIDAEKRRKLQKSAEEFGLLANAYKELADEFSKNL